MRTVAKILFRCIAVPTENLVSRAWIPHPQNVNVEGEASRAQAFVRPAFPRTIIHNMVDCKELLAKLTAASTSTSKARISLPSSMSPTRSCVRVVSVPMLLSIGQGSFAGASATGMVLPVTAASIRTERRKRKFLPAGRACLRHGTIIHGHNHGRQSHPAPAVTA